MNALTLADARALCRDSPGRPRRRRLRLRLWSALLQLTIDAEFVARERCPLARPRGDVEPRNVVGWRVRGPRP